MSIKKFGGLTLIALSISLGVALFGGSESASAIKCRKPVCRNLEISVYSVANGGKLGNSLDGEISGRGSWMAENVDISIKNTSTMQTYTKNNVALSGLGLPRPTWAQTTSGVSANIPDGIYDLTFTVNSPTYMDSRYPKTLTLTGVKYDKSGATIVILGSNPVTVAKNSTYTDAGATASDSIDGNLTGSIVATSNVNTSVPGSYSVTYKVTDSSGNVSQATRTVIVTGSTTATTDTGANITLASAVTDDSTLGANENDKRVFEDQNFAVADIDDQNNNSAKKTWLWVGVVLAAAITGGAIYLKNKPTSAKAKTTSKKK
jgi:hypothetical protein